MKDNTVEMIEKEMRQKLKQAARKPIHRMSEKQHVIERNLENFDQLSEQDKLLLRDELLAKYYPPLNVKTNNDDCKPVYESLALLVKIPLQPLESELNKLAQCWSNSVDNNVAFTRWMKELKPGYLKTMLSKLGLKRLIIGGKMIIAAESELNMNEEQRNTLKNEFDSWIHYYSNLYRALDFMAQQTNEKRVEAIHLGTKIAQQCLEKGKEEQKDALRKELARKHGIYETIRQQVGLNHSGELQSNQIAENDFNDELCQDIMSNIVEPMARNEPMKVDDDKEKYFGHCLNQSKNFIEQFSPWVSKMNEADFKNLLKHYSGNQFAMGLTKMWITYELITPKDKKDEKILKLFENKYWLEMLRKFMSMKDEMNQLTPKKMEDLAYIYANLSHTLMNDKN